MLDEKKYIRKVIEIAQQARDNGNHPFGALLVDENGQFLLEAGNTVVTGNDITNHAEMNLVRKTAASYDGDFLAKCTLYASTEPCPMCSGAIFWANIRRVVYGLSAEKLYEIVGFDSEEVLNLTCRDIFDKGQKKIEVVGPILENEALIVQHDFWK